MRPPFLAPSVRLILAMSVGAFSISAAAGSAWPEPSQLPVRAELPNPLVMFDGSAVRTRAEWQEKRRPELKSLFEHYMYGKFPPAPARVEQTIEREDRNYFGGKATKREVLIRLGSDQVAPIHLLVVIPNQRSKPAPVVLGLNFCGNYSVLNDPTIPLPTGWMPNMCPGCTNNHATEAGRGRQVEVWSIESSIDRGYAMATLYNGDLEPDRAGAAEGIRNRYAAGGGTDSADSWGTIAAWAWGLQRAVDYLVTDRDIDPQRIAVFGHSRNGKTALLAAAFDERIALAIPHQAGCGGTAPSRGTVGESVRQINTSFPHWFDAVFKQFNDQPQRLPFDQHCLVALCAPRPVLLSNAIEDTWANPAGQFEMLKAAAPVYRLYGVDALATSQMPETGKLIDSTLGYYIRPGKHSTTPDDWKVFLDFADAHFGKPAR